jgi:hypothetical protein
MPKPILIQNPSSLVQYLSPKSTDLSGQTFNHVTVLYPIAYEKQGQWWLCQCECGKFFITSTGSLKAGYILSCGCKRANDLVGKRFGKLIVLRRLPYKRYGKNVFWECRCECGNITEVPTCHLQSGLSTSCGCSHTPSLQGENFGKLMVISLSNKRNKKRERYWKCRCECGNITYVTTTKLQNGEIRSCKNNCSNIVDLTGKRFGYLTVLEPGKKKRQTSGKHRIFWTCRCDCGNIVQIEGGCLRSGNTKSCGCKHWYTGEDHHSWNPDLTQEEREEERNTYENREWKKSVLKKGKYLCVICGTNGKESKLIAHHLNSYIVFPDDRYKVSNGIVLCKKCHIIYHHSAFPKQSATKEQWRVFCKYYKKYFGRGVETRKLIKQDIKMDGRPPGQLTIFQKMRERYREVNIGRPDSRGPQGP